jgi:hypothetical protein
MQDRTEFTKPLISYEITAFGRKNNVVKDEFTVKITSG